MSEQLIESPIDSKIKFQSTDYRIDDGRLLITASPQLAADRKRRFLQGQSREVVATPDIFFWSEWITRLANGDDTLPVPLTRMQELLLWEKIIRNDLESKSGPHHISLKGLAKRAAKAYATMREQNIDAAELTPGGEESEALARWIRALKSEMERGRFGGRTLAANIPELLIPRLPNLPLPEHIVLDGFESITPIQQQLLDTLQQQGCSIFTSQSDQVPTTPTLTPCQSAASELTHLALRIKKLLDQNLSARIAILTSDSFTDSKMLRRELDRMLMPESLIDPFCNKQSVSIEAGPLSDWPMIQQILHLLSLTGSRSIPLTDFSILLFSPCLGGFDNERLGRAALDATLRWQNHHHISLTRLLAGSRLDGLPALRDITAALAEWESSSRAASHWVKAVHALLQALGILQAGLDHQSLRSDAEIRQMNRFRDALTSLTAADVVHSRMSWSQFLSLLRTSCSEMRLAPPSLFPNVSVMPLSQIAGLSFDHIFVLAMDEQAFPPAARPQPLLPMSLQRKYGIPMSSGTRQFESAQWLWRELLLAAPDIEISYAEQRDEREFQPSPFVKELGNKESADSETTTHKIELETYDDAMDFPLQADENIRGGTSIIKNQAACPFRAFATHRLSISALEETSPGLEPTSKGSLVHLALEYIWKQLQTQAALTALGENETVELVDAAIRYAWDESHITANATTKTFEQKRMRHLLAEWLQLELERPDFKVISIEQEYLLQLPETSSPQFTVKIKADRMDRDASGHRILIDYKTGAKQPTSKWLNERIEEPQLPQYALAANLGVNDAVAFARVRSGDMAYEGLSGESIGIKGITACDGKRKAPEDWQQLLDDWKVNINALASEFVQGRCEVSPRDANACKYCGFEAICRINETGFDSEVEEA